MHSNDLSRENYCNIILYAHRLALFTSLISLSATLAIAQPHDVVPQTDTHRVPKTLVSFCGQELSIYTPEIECDQAVGDWSPLTSFKHITWISLSGPAVNSLASFALLPACRASKRSTTARRVSAAPVSKPIAPAICCFNAAACCSVCGRKLFGTSL